jgi:tungstate transport system ATP-binding protein
MIREIVFSIHGLRKYYDGNCVLQVNSLDIYRNEIFAVVGPSGSGKSTFLRLLNFLERPTEGKIFYNQHEFSSIQDITVPVRRQVTTVFQSPLLLNRSVEANVEYGLKLHGKNDTSQSIHEVLRKVGLQDMAGRRPRTLSGGEAQRVALARAMILQPEVLLLDEPTANLDPYNVKLIEEIVLELNNNPGTTIVMVTHNVFQARRLANRVGFLLNGKIIEVSDADIFFNTPTDPRTAAFVKGEMVY